MYKVNIYLVVRSKNQFDFLWSVNHLTWSGSTWWCDDMGTLSTLLALVREIHWSPVDSPHKWSVMQNFTVFFVVVSLKLLQAEEVVEQITKFPDIWTAMLLMWHHCDGIWVCEASCHTWKPYPCGPSQLVATRVTCEVSVTQVVCHWSGGLIKAEQVWTWIH